MQKPYRRQRKKNPSTLSTKFEAQKIAFAPFTFQAIYTMRELGVLDFLDQKHPDGARISDITDNCNISEYAASTLMEVAEVTNIVTYKDDEYTITLLGQTFIHDEMTRIHMDFAQNTCYLGMKNLKKSFITGKPEGLNVFGDYKNFYYALPHLPEKPRDSWYAFDHFYSDDSFLDVMSIIFKDNPKMIFDVGGNTGKFTLCCVNHDDEVGVTIVDLPAQIDVCKENIKKHSMLNRCHFYPIDILDQDTVMPDGADVIWMSQFIDCFSKEEIVLILKKTINAMDRNTRLFILEPFWDKQTFEAARYSLVHISLYFSCIANGNSKMYSEKEILECIKSVGLHIQHIHYNVGRHEYTLIECTR